MNWIPDFLSQNFRDLPKTAKVVVYFAVLVAGIYLIFLPQSIHGYVFFKDGSGGMHPYRGAEVLVSAGGHDYKYLVNENGWFTVPVVSKLPTGVIRLGLVHKDTGGLYEVEISNLSLFGWDDHRIEVTNKPTGFKLVEVSFEERTLLALENAVGKLFPGALAEKLVLPSEVQPLPQTEARAVRDSISQIVGGVANVAPAELNRDFPFAQRLSYTDRIQVVERIETAYRIKVPDEHWKQLRTLGEVEGYVTNRLALERAKPQGSVNWAEYQRSFDRKLFK